MTAVMARAREPKRAEKPQGDLAIVLWCGQLLWKFLRPNALEGADLLAELNAAAERMKDDQERR